MTVGELKEKLDQYDNNMEVVIGMIQNHGLNFASQILIVEPHLIKVFVGDAMRAVVITEGSRIGSVNYAED